MKLFGVMAPAVAVAFVVACLPLAGFAYSVSSDDEFCQRGQQLISDSGSVSDNIVYSEWMPFQKSKANEWPLTTHQFVNSKLADGTETNRPVSVSCKFKTAERINDGLQRNGKLTDALKAHQENDCKSLNRQILTAVTAELEKTAADANLKTDFVFDEDEVTWVGPLWLRPFPYQVAYLGEDGKTHIRSKSLYTEYSVFIPMPASFKGTHYCHLIAPEYLSDLVTGQSTAPKLMAE